MSGAFHFFLFNKKQQFNYLRRHENGEITRKLLSEILSFLKIVKQCEKYRKTNKFTSPLPPQEPSVSARWYILHTALQNPGFN